MNRMPILSQKHRWCTAAILLMLLSAVGSYAQTAKAPIMAVDSPAGGTIETVLVCTPTSGTLPMSIQISSTTYNQSSSPRDCFGRVDLQTAGGLYLAGISYGIINVPAGSGEYVHVAWIKQLPPRIENVGLNRYLATVTDITAPPYNQPPYPDSGSVAVDSCEVTCAIP